MIHLGNVPWPLFGAIIFAVLAGYAAFYALGRQQGYEQAKREDEVPF